MTPVAAAARFITACPIHAKVLVAVSGGSDSTGLLVALHDAVHALKRHDISLIAATVDHALRSGSGAEAQTVSDFCDKLNIPHHVATWSDEKPKTGIPAAARLARYHLLSDIADHVSATCIVTGHTLNDQQETISMRADRSQPDSVGLSGMAHAMLFDRKVWVARPFLDVGRADIRNYLLNQNVSWIEDPTNINDAFERARVRKALAEHSPSDTSGDTDHATRHGISESVAAFLVTNAEVLDRSVAVVDRKACRMDPSGPRALATLLAIIGGRQHLPGREVVKKLTTVLHSDEDTTMTLSRSAITFRKDRIYITRESRDLPSMVLGSGQSGYWDNRFSIRNKSDDAVTVSGASGKQMGMAKELFQLPKSVARRAICSMPQICVTDASSQSVDMTQKSTNLFEIEIEPIFPLFDLFLPIFDLSVANCVSQLFGRTAFPAFPVDYM